MTDKKYLETHEWYSVKDNEITVGISDFAKCELGDFVFVTLRTVDESYSKEYISEISSNLDISKNWLYWNDEEVRIEMPLSIAEYLSEEVEYPIAMIEVHPTHERLEVGLVWLNEYR